jgi:hypothetical protein
MDRSERKAAVSAYKDLPLDWGVYAVRCSATSETWVGGSRHLSKQRNGLFFTLRMGNCRHTALQASWTAHGEAAFSLDPLEQLPADTPAISRVRLLKERTAHWLAALEALPL